MPRFCLDHAWFPLAAEGPVKSLIFQQWPEVYPDEVHPGPVSGCKLPSHPLGTGAKAESLGHSQAQGLTRCWSAPGQGRELGGDKALRLL